MAKKHNLRVDLSRRGKKMCNLGNGSETTTKRKVACCVSALALLSLGLFSTALFFFWSNRGGSALMEAVDELVLTEGLSTAWCQEVSVRSADTDFLFNVSVVHGPPKFDTAHQQVSTKWMNIFVATNDYEMLRYYLPATSSIHILQCANEANLMSYIFKGKNVDDECLKLTDQRLPWFRNDFDTDDWQHRPKKVGKDPCAQITLQRFLVKVCKGTQAKMQPMDANIAADDYYIIYYKGSQQADANVTLKLTLRKPTYDVTDRLHFCTQVANCTLPLRWGSEDSVIVETGLGKSASSKPQTIYWYCHPNWIAYGVIFAAVPALVVLVVFMVALICRRRRRRRVSERQPLIGEGESDQRQEERLQHDKYGATEASAGPLVAPAYDTRPTAPPDQQQQQLPFIPDAIVQPFYDRDPPPPYEETPTHSQRVAEKC